MRKIRVFAAFPDDVTEERNHFQAVVEELNHSRIVHELDTSIELIRREIEQPFPRDISREIHDDHIASEDWSVFIGVLWHDFALPYDQTDNLQWRYLLGTRQEFRIAVEQWSNQPAGWPRFMLYRRIDIAEMDERESNAIAAQESDVNIFFNSYITSDDYTVLVNEYGNPIEFERQIKNHLIDLLYDYYDLNRKLDVADISWEERDQDAIDYFIERYSENHKKSLGEKEILHLFQRWNLVKNQSVLDNDNEPISEAPNDYYFTNNGALLFGPQDEISAQTDVYISYHNESDQLIRLEGLCLIRLVQELISHLAPLWSRTWEELSKRDGNGKPLQVHIYPQTAIVEAAINLIIHRDYSSIEKSYVDIYDDRVVFTNPGSSQLDLDSLIDQSVVKRIPYKRNNQIINVFTRVGLTLTQRRGLKGIRESLQNNGTQGPDGGSPFEIESSEGDNTFILTIFAAQSPEQAQSIHESGIEIAGDVVHGDKIIQYVDSTDVSNQRAHSQLRRIVREIWIEGFMKSSIKDETFIHLNLEEQPDLVATRPWDLVIQKDNQPNTSLSSDGLIIDIFDQMNQNMLILGLPGSGKTMMLLKLAEALLDRADNSSIHPTPVIFNLSSWSVQRLPLGEWFESRINNDIQLAKKTCPKLDRE